MNFSNTLRRPLWILVALVVGIGMSVSAKTHQFKTYENDPYNTLEYTLPNGLKVFMSVNKDRPRIQANIAVRVGGKNDPAETTGLAHYFEHLMFKGTKLFGTQDYAKEEPMLDQIEQLFEVYRKTTDEAQRKALYRQIDSISYEASKIAIPNEYDKLMSAIGAQGTNAYTSQDVTCYVENIPSNQIENWAKIQADRFENPILRGFHTELETIYEEKNMSLTNDGRKLQQAMLEEIFPNHPYGTQTVLGTQENLKNPSITNVKNYHKQWYVPNNMAISLAGDFDPDQMVDIIEKYFGHLKPNPNLPVLDFKPEVPITSPISRDVYGRDAEFVYVTWRLPEAKHEDMAVLNMLDAVMNNGKTGLLDLNVNLPQRTLGAGSFLYDMADGGVFILTGRAKGDQTLEDVKDILIAEMKNLCEGNFSDDLIEAVVKNHKKDFQQGLESNSSRAGAYVNAFVNGEDWQSAVDQINNMDKITKADVVRVANKYFNQNNYAAIYKRQGEDKSEIKMAKPELTPIVMNRDASSAFLREIQNSKVQPIEPVFIDYDKEIEKYQLRKSVDMYYAKNDKNDLFYINFIYPYGTNNDNLINFGAQLLNLYGTKTMTPTDIKNEFYKLACTFSVGASEDETNISISGLNENMPAALRLYEKILSESVADAETYAKYIARVDMSRKNAKKNQDQNFAALNSYLRYGKKNQYNTIISVDSLMKMDPGKSLESVRKIRDYEHNIVYYGKDTPKQVLSILKKDHIISKKLTKPEKVDLYQMVVTDKPKVYLLNYPSKQIRYRQFSNKGEKFDISKNVLNTLYNDYFSGSMNAVVFQEMRERRSLAYSASANYSTPSRLDRPYTYIAFIATQNDKMGDAIKAFDEIINDMPQSEAALDLSKKSLDSNYRTSRILGSAKIGNYLYLIKKLGFTTDPRKEAFEKIPTLTMADLVKYQQENIKGRTYHYAILGEIKDLDMEFLKNLGEVVVLTQEDVFGY